MILIPNSRNIRYFYRKSLLNCSCVSSVRLKSSAEPKIKTYSHTILSPKTNFPARSNNAKKEEIQKIAQFSELYNWQREHLAGQEYVLHDGPPYANGDLHMGHAVNKIIKDINNRSQVLQGNRVHYVPGWDCHGLPIELKALQKAKKKTKNAPTDPVNIRKIAREFALETVEKQKAAFEKWGVMADWKKQYYLTLNNGYVKNQLHQFYNMYKEGYIFRALKPVYWSPSSRTALAEAELEYDPQYKSTEVYVTFPLEGLPDVVKSAAKGKAVSAIIWTTTPWTLVANRAICFNPQMKYSVVTLDSRPGDLFVVGSGLIGGLESVFETKITKLVEFDGHHLAGTKYYNKLVKETLPFLEGEHVTEGKGTGLVHTAPAHGPEDFLVALKNNMAVKCKVDEAGRYTNIDAELNGLPVLSEGQELVISRLADSVIRRGTYIHSYPLDWRTKQPIIIRASQQWFIDTAQLKEKAKAALEKVEILPSSSAEQSRQGFRAQLEKRPYWCISRQRAWGVPIPALYCGDDVIVHEGIIDKLCSLIDSDGPDVWWTHDAKQFLPEDLAKKMEGKQITKGQDIMDIWFDSGISWSTLGGAKANLYSEGLDQLTGWFQASLLTSIALTGEAPYRYGDLSKPTAGPQGKHNNAKMWDTLRDLLNQDPVGETKNTEKWRKTWSDFKNNCKRKAARIHNAATRTGGGPASTLQLTALESRVMQIIGIQAATGIPSISEIGLGDINQQRQEQDGSLQPQEQNTPMTGIEDQGCIQVFVESLESLEEVRLREEVSTPNVIVVPATFEPQQGQSFEPQPGPSFEPRPGPSFEPQPGPSGLQRGSESVSREETARNAAMDEEPGPSRPVSAARTVRRRPASREPVVGNAPLRSPLRRRGVRRQLLASPSHHRFRETQADRVASQFLRCDEEWRQFRIEQERQNRPLRSRELDLQERWQEITVRFIDMTERLLNRYLDQ